MTMQDSPRAAEPQQEFFAVDALRSGKNERGFKLTMLEKQVSKAIVKLVEADADPYVLAMAELAMSLAANIAAGNVKGRAVANEATALRETLASLQADTLDAAGAETGHVLPENVIDFVAAMGKTPKLGRDARSM